MTPKKAKAAAQLAAAQYGRAQRKASELIMFWFDSETGVACAPVEILARAVGEHSGTQLDSGRCHRQGTQPTCQRI